MKIEEMIHQEITHQFEVHLTDEEQIELHDILDDWATDDEILWPGLYAELRDEIAPIMKLTHPDAFAILGCLEAVENFGPMHDKFASCKIRSLPS